MSTLPLMPKATAVWLVENTALTFDQIANFCGLHPLEVKGIADGEVAQGIVGLDPVSRGQLAQEEIERCEGDPRGSLNLMPQNIPLPKSRSKGPRYTPVSRRQDRPDAIAWLVRNHAELSDAQICKLVGTTKPTIQSVRDRSHWNTTNIKPNDPVNLGLCTQIELDEAVEKAALRVKAANPHGDDGDEMDADDELDAGAHGEAETGVDVDADEEEDGAPGWGR